MFPTFPPKKTIYRQKHVREKLVVVLDLWRMEEDFSK